MQLIPGVPARTGSGLLVTVQDRGTTRSLLVGGKLVTPIGLQIREVVAVTGESVLFIASDEPTEEHLWVHEDGLARRLSDRPGVHVGQRAAGVLVLDSVTDDRHEVQVLRAG